MTRDEAIEKIAEFLAETKAFPGFLGWENETEIIKTRFRVNAEWLLEKFPFLAIVDRNESIRGRVLPDGSFENGIGLNPAWRLKSESRIVSQG